MKSTTVRDTKGFVIGFIEDNGDEITYRSITYGVIAFYDKRINLYKRVKAMPGEPVVSYFGDMGERDIRYWGDK